MVDSKTVYIVATIKDWNIKAFKQYSKKIPGHWLLITDKEELTAEKILKVKPKYIFFPHWSWLVPDEILNFTDCICFHMTDVPYGRGGSPLQNLITSGHDRTKISALKMIREMDAGPIYMKRDLSLEGSAQQIYERCATIVFEMIEEIVLTDPTPISQEGEPLYFERRTPQMSKLPKQGPMEQIYNHIRMLDAETYPKSYIDYGDLKIELSDARKVKNNLEAKAIIKEKRNQITPNDRVLVVVAHPDDEVIGVGGTISRHTEQGDEVFILILGEGVTSRNSELAIEKRSLELERLYQASRKAARILGAKLLGVKGLADNRMDSYDMLDVIKHVEESAEEVSPTIIYTHHPGDLNIDHQIVHRAVVTAFRPLPEATFSKIYTFPTLSSTEWGGTIDKYGFRPTKFVNIKMHLEKKINALSCYAQEMRKFPHPRSEVAIKAQAELWGATVGMSAAEAFSLIWEIER